MFIDSYNIHHCHGCATLRSLATLPFAFQTLLKHMDLDMLGQSHPGWTFTRVLSLSRIKWHCCLAHEVHMGESETVRQELFLLK